MERALFFTEGGAAFGFGHLVRCLALAHGLESLGVPCQFIVRGDSSVERILQGREYRRTDWQNDPTLPGTEANGETIAVIDSYHAGLPFYQAASRICRLAVYLDDTLRLPYPPGLVLNGAPGAETLAYPKTAGVRYALGSRYALLRPPFRERKPRRFSDAVESVLVTFGGSDMAGVTPLAIKVLSRVLPDAALHVVVGGGNGNREQVEAAATGKTKIHLHLDANAMARLMEACDLALSAGGQTAMELAATATPAVIVRIADNQRHIVRVLEEARAILFAGASDDPDLETRMERTVRAALPRQARETLAKNLAAVAPEDPDACAKTIMEYAHG